MPAACLALPLLAGSVAGILLDGRAPEHLILAAAGGSVLALVAATGFFLDHHAGAVVGAVAAGAALAGYSSGASTIRDLYAPTLLAWYDARPEDPDPVTVVGTLLDDAASGAGGPLLTIRVSRVRVSRGESVRAEGGLRLSVGGSPSAEDVRRWHAGRVVRLPALLRRPTSFANPGLPDDARALARRGIVLLGTVKSAALVEIVGNGTALEEAAARVRAWTRRTLATFVGALDARSSAVATAIVIGDRTGLSDDDERRLQDAGTYHVIAISGGNIAILAAVLVGLARACRVPYRLAASVTIAVLLFYGEVAGGAASVGRATTAAVIFLFALVVDHRGTPINVLAVAAVLAVGLTPVTVVDAGFLLSFGATAGIVLGVPALLPSRLGTAGRAVAGVLAATVCAEVALMPVAASLFSRVTLGGLVLNFVAIPLMTVVQCGSLVLLALSGWGPPVTGWLAVLVHRAAQGLVESAALVEFAPWVARDVPAPAWWFCGAYYLLAAGALASGRSRRVVVALLGAAILAVFAGVPAFSRGLVPKPRPGVLRVVVLDVGQGDATVAILPDGRALLVDAGGLAGTSFDIGGRVIVPALRALRVRGLYALVLTHGDPDHTGGAETVMRSLAPRQVWEGVTVPPNPTLRALVELAVARRIAWRTVRPRDVDRLGDVVVRVHHPPEPDWERQRVRNDDSVVLELRYRDVSILLPGDIGREVEAGLIGHLDLAPVVVLKAAHHGSATSSSEAFLDAVRPGAVIFSAGKNNPFNHPAPVVVDRVARRGIAAFSTATDGAVFVETDGQSAEVYGWHTGRRLDTRTTKSTKITKKGR